MVEPAWSGDDDAAVIEDGGLVVAVARGDAEAFRELYERHARGVYNMVLRSVREPRAAEDLCQEIWLKVHRELPKLREPGAFRTWLYRVAAKSCIDACRRRARRPAAGALAGELADHRASPETAAMEREASRLAWEALAALPANQHLALFLKEVEGRSYREIADVLKISETAVGLCLLRARRSFGRSYERLKEAAAAERCGRTRSAMAALIDGEADAVQQLAVRAHVAGCRACERDLTTLRQVSRRYGALATLSVPALLSARILAESAALAGMAGGGAGIAKLLALLATRAKPLAFAVTAGGGLTAAALVTSPPEPANFMDAGAAATPAHARMTAPPGGASAGADLAAVPVAASATPTPAPTATAGLALPTRVALPLLTPFVSLLTPALMPTVTQVTAPLAPVLTAVAPITDPVATAVAPITDPLATAVAPVTDPLATAGAPITQPVETVVAALPTPPPLLQLP